MIEPIDIPHTTGWVPVLEKINEIIEVVNLLDAKGTIAELSFTNHTHDVVETNRTYHRTGGPHVTMVDDSDAPNRD